MARYTTELRNLMVDINVRPLLDKALSSYPMYEPMTSVEEVRSVIPTREQLNQKLLNHYKYREIAFETVGRFIDELEITMNEIMPYYNQMYKTVETMFTIDDIFGNVDVKETYKETRSGMAKSNDSGNVVSSSSDSNETTSTANDSSETTSNVNSLSKTLESETPQGNISKSASEIDNVTHADKGTWDKKESNSSANTSGNSSSNATSSGSTETNSTSTNESERESTETVEHTFQKKGNQGVNTYAHDMNEFRTTIIDVTMQIIENKKVKELFMQVF